LNECLFYLPVDYHITGWPNLYQNTHLPLHPRAMSSTSRGGSAAAASSTTASPVAHSESMVTAGGNCAKMGGDTDTQRGVEGGGGGGGGGDVTQDPDLLHLPVGYTPHLPSSSEPPSLQNRPRRLVWVVCSGLHILREVTWRVFLDWSEANFW